MVVKPTYHATYNALTQAEKDALKDQRKKNGKMMFCIHQAMHESILPIFVKILCNCKEYSYPLLWINIKYIYY
jgi:hypothetical protein